MAEPSLSVAAIPSDVEAGDHHRELCRSPGAAARRRRDPGSAGPALCAAPGRRPARPGARWRSATSASLTPRVMARIPPSCRLNSTVSCSASRRSRTESRSLPSCRTRSTRSWARRRTTEPVVGHGAGATASTAAAAGVPEATALTSAVGSTGGLEQGNRPAHAEDGLRLPDLLQPVLHPVPVVETASLPGMTKYGFATPACTAPPGQQRPVPGEGRGRSAVQSSWPSGPGSSSPNVRTGGSGRAPTASGCCAEQVVGEHVEHPRLVDALRGVLPEQHVAPVEDVVDVGHHHGAPVGDRAQLGDRVRVERVVQVGLDQPRGSPRHVVAALQAVERPHGLPQAGRGPWR